METNAQWCLFYKLFIGLIVALDIVQSRSVRTSENEAIIGQDDEIPDYLVLEIPLENKTMKLNLEKSDTVEATIPVFLGTDQNVFIQWDSRNRGDFKVYQDMRMHASFVMWYSQNWTQQNSGVYGIFDDDQDGESYAVEILDMEKSHFKRSGHPSGAGKSRDNPKTVKIFGSGFTVSKVDRATIMNSATEQLVNEDTMKMDHKIKEFLENPTNQGHDLPYMSYGVEVFLVLDFAIFNKWISRSTSLDYMNREAEAVDNIRYYFAHVLNGMSMRYQSARDTRYDIKIIPVGMYIAKSAKASFWTEAYPIKQGDRHTEAYDALDSFEEWINTNKEQLPVFDQATLFTGNQLFNGYLPNGERRIINGLADIMGVCRYRRASINYDLGQYGCIQNGAHELGHNLGAYHDGYNNPCSSFDQYIMAVSPGELHQGNYNNPLQFSYCSRNRFFEYLLYLLKNGTNCLTAKNNYETNWDYSDYLGQSYIGQRFSADEQCKLVHGTKSFYCGGGHRDEKICGAMYCWVDYDNKCRGGPEQRAADGTPCGDGKWCLTGQCVQDARAPNFKDPNCIYGDYKDIVDPKYNYHCPEMGKREPQLCYDNFYKSQCCETCEQVRDRAAPLCEYGDRNPEYCRTQLRAMDCYSDNIQKDCCMTCTQIKVDLGNKIGCEYGDKSSFCKDQNRPSMCYQNNQTCCGTCPALQLGPEGCEWGDKYSWCGTANNRDCYRPEYSEGCCSRCEKLKTGPPGCEWGDRMQYCTIQDCDDPYTRKSCCKTCVSYFTTPAVTAVPTTVSPKPTQWYPSSPSECQFGDSYSWCNTYVYNNGPRVCIVDATVQSGCCFSCSQIQQTQVHLTTIPSSSTTILYTDECIDEGSYCDSLIRSGRDCYKNLKLCCRTCSQYFTGVTGCEFGNAYSWCQTYVTNNGIYACKVDANVRDGCCFSCGQLENQLLTSVTPEPTTSTASTTSLMTTNTTQSTTLQTIDVNTPACVDHETNCKNQILSGRDCYRMASACCASCTRYSTIIPECEFGDHYSWCQSYVANNGPKVCTSDPVVRNGCCQSCFQFQKPIEGNDENCKDSVSWCKDIARRDCYHTSTEDSCCASCKRFRTESSSCPYGDVFSWCKVKYCEVEAKNCCETCWEWITNT